MRAEVKENLAVLGKTLIFVVGAILFIVALLDLVVGGPSVRSIGFLLAGGVLAGVPLGLAFRDALREARRRGAKR